MPYHSSTNFYKAELEEYEYQAHKKWVDTDMNRCPWWYLEIYSCDDDDDLFEPCHCSRSESCPKCDWRYSYYSNPSYTFCNCCLRYKEDCNYEYKFCSCKDCDAFMNTKCRKKLIQRYFNPQQILQYNTDIVLEHVEKHCVSCFHYLRDFLWKHCDKFVHKKVVDKYIESEQFNGVDYPHEMVNMDMMALCVIEVLQKKLRKTIIEKHKQEERKLKEELLAKYGLTYEEYKQFRIQRQLAIEAQMTPPPPPKGNALVIPQQKFIKVKEKTLKTGHLHPILPPRIKDSIFTQLVFGLA